MATVKSLVQLAGHSDTHNKAINLLLKEGWDDYLISSAFVVSSGVLSVEKFLKKNHDKITVFIGIRNGVTSIQGLMELLKTGVTVYTVDTGTTSPIFHPKIYCGWNQEKAHVIIGSSNLTHNGLHNNIEASARIELDKTNKCDSNYLKHLRQSFDLMIKKYPEHVIAVKSIKDAVKLFQEGLLEDQRIKRNTILSNQTRCRSTIQRSIINLKFQRPKASKYRKFKNKMIQKRSNTSVTRILQSSGNLVWTKQSLPKSDLQFTASHAVGVLRLTQSKFIVGKKVIDQTTYFRNVVFSNLSWSIDPKDNKKEVAWADFELIIAGVSYSTFNLKLSHKSTWSSNQGNYTTAIHWGSATSVIHQKSLIGRSLNIYEPHANSAIFTIEII